jgi:hypothetical protein
VRWVRPVLRVGEPLVVTVGGFSQRVVRAGDVIKEPMSEGLAGGHVMDVGAVVDLIRLMRSAGFSTAAGAIVFVLEATHGGAEVSDVGCVSEAGGCLKVGEYAGAGLVGFFCIALGIMIGCIGAE